MQHSRPWRVLLVLVLGLVASVPAGAQRDGSYELWSVLMVDDQRAGHVLEQVEVGDGTITTIVRSSMSMRRGPASIEVSVEGTFVETPAHEPLRWHTVVSMGGAPVEQTFTFSDDGIEVVRHEGQRESRQTRPALEDGWLTPGGVRELLRLRLGAGARTISYSTLDPTQGLTPVHVRLDGIEATSVDVLGKTISAHKATMTSTALPGVPTTVWIDDQGRTVRSEVGLAGMTIVTVAADRELAQSQLDPPELMARTFVRTARAIERPRQITDASYILRVREGTLPDLPETSSQRVERIDERTVRVIVRENGRFAGGLAREGDERLIGASPMLDTDDPLIRDLARRGAGSSDDPAFVAERMRQVVFRHVRTKDLGVGFASASEVARSRQGDCSEHAVLHAAMLRARGIPARVVSGLVYADGFLGERNIFGYHMWVQALLEVGGQRRWVDLDPTLGPTTPFDATHIALVISTLEEGEGSNALVRLAPLLGTLEIEIESVE